MLFKMPPSKIFIVPYRNRIQHKYFFSTHMTNIILKDKEDYEIYFSHQSDTRNFNRGATKNIGFLAMKEKYPDNYRDITFIFNDIDTLPFTNIFNYETTPGVVKHYYGFKYALGGIVVIKGSDFERINGYPCYWGWGNEDNCLQDRCIKSGIKIDRSDFYPVGNPNILQLFDGMARLISKKDPWRHKNDTGKDGLNTITGLEYEIGESSTNFNDNIYVVHNPRIFYVNTTKFNTMIPENGESYYKYDLREPAQQIVNPNKLEMIIDNSGSFKIPATNEVKEMMNDWSYIPDRPDSNKNYRNEMSDYKQYITHMNSEISMEQRGVPLSPSPGIPYGIKNRHVNPMNFQHQPRPPYNNHQKKISISPHHPNQPYKNPFYRPAPSGGGGGNPNNSNRLRFM